MKWKTSDKALKSWLWKLFEITVKAFFDAILDKLNPS